MISVQFVGLPGAGKTTIRNKLIQSLQRTEGRRCLSIEEAFLHASRKNMDRMYRPFLNIMPIRMATQLSNKLINRSQMQFEAQNAFLAKHGKALDAFLSSAIYGDMSMEDRTLVISAFLEAGALYESIQGQFSDHTVVLFEEGLIQKSLMFVSHRGGQEPYLPYLHAYLEHLPAPDLVVYIQADVETCYDRMTRRPAGLTRRLEEADKTSIMNFLVLADRHLRDVMAWLQDHAYPCLVATNHESQIRDALLYLEERVRERL